MQIVIEIPKEIWEQIEKGYVPLGISKYLKNGTPLPQEHGGLINADALKSTLEIEQYNDYDDLLRTERLIDNTPIIIEADKKEDKEK